jgi:amidase
MKPLLDQHRDLLKPEVVWNIEKGLRLTGADVARAEAQRGALFRRMLDFFERYDLILCPTTIVPPFPVEQRFVTECEGVVFETYIDWLTIVSAVTLCCCPAISIPCGFTAEGLPIGLQVVAPPRGEARLLAGARFIEEVLGLGAITPIDPRVPGLT